MKKILSVLILCLSVSGCSQFLELMDIPSKKGIEVETQFGDRENQLQLDGSRATGNIEDVEGNISIQNNTSSASVESTGQVIINNTPILVLIIAILGWVLPTPLSMAKIFITGLKEIWLLLTHPLR